MGGSLEKKWPAQLGFAEQTFNPKCDLPIDIQLSRSSTYPLDFQPGSVSSLGDLLCGRNHFYHFRDGKTVVEKLGADGGRGGQVRDERSRRATPSIIHARL